MQSTRSSGARLAGALRCSSTVASTRILIQAYSQLTRAERLDDERLTDLCLTQEDVRPGRPMSGNAVRS
jgi:hypothetical protein